MTFFKLLSTVLCWLAVVTVIVLVISYEEPFDASYVDGGTRYKMQVSQGEAVCKSALERISKANAPPIPYCSEVSYLKIEPSASLEYLHASKKREWRSEVTDVFDYSFGIRLSSKTKYFIVNIKLLVVDALFLMVVGLESFEYLKNRSSSRATG